MTLSLRLGKADHVGNGDDEKQVSAFHAIPVTVIATLSLKLVRGPFARNFRIRLLRPQLEACDKRSRVVACIACMAVESLRK